MLEVSNGNITTKEKRSHFGRWDALMSPLIICTPADTIYRDILDILSNDEPIVFNQDEVYSASAMTYKWSYNEDGTLDLEHPTECLVGTSVKGIHVFMLDNQDRAVKMAAVYLKRYPN